MNIPTILSTDLGSDIDDALHLQIIALSKAFKLASVIVTHGVLDTRAKLARKMLHNLGRDEVTVAQGAENAMDLSCLLPPFLTGFEAIGLSATERDAKAQRIDGVELFIRQVKELFPVVISIAPMTTIALALQREPDVVRNIRHLYVLAGSLEVPEHNIVRDPEAADIVLSSDLQITLVPLEATQQVCHTELTELRGSSNQRLIAKMAKALRICRAIDMFVTQRSPESKELHSKFKHFAPFTPSTLRVDPNEEAVFLQLYENFKGTASRLDPSMLQCYEDQLKTMELFMLLRLLLDKNRWIEDFDSRFTTLSLCLNMHKVIPSHPHELFAKAFNAGLGDKMGVFDAYVPFVMEQPEKARIEKCTLRLEGAQLVRSEGDKHNLVVDIDQENFRQFLRRRLRADGGLKPKSGRGTKIR